MLTKIFLVAALSLSALCFAGSGGENTASSADSDRQIRTPESDSSATKKELQPASDSKGSKKSSMVDFCKKNIC
jgi:hypothetical protein